MLLNINNDILNTALAAIMISGIAAGLLSGEVYIPYTALAVAGLVWYFVCRWEMPRPVVEYVVLVACMLLAVSTYADTKHILTSPNIASVACMMAGLVGLGVVLRWAVSHTPPTLRV